MNINERLRKLQVGSKYGAQMGRTNYCDNETAKVYLQAIFFQDGDYDLGGAYWGGGGEPLWCAMDEDGDVLIFLRAPNREDAIESLSCEHPGLVVAHGGDIDVDEFTRHYAIAALWSTTDDDDSPLDDKYGVGDISPADYAQMRDDCAKFIQENAQWLLQWDGGRYSIEEMGGHDFWLTRNGHGAGFWDGDWPEEAGDALTQSSKRFGEVYLYIDDSQVCIG